MADVHVLLVYSLKDQQLLSQEEFASEDQGAAFESYAAAEAEHRDSGDVEIVLVGADSVQTIMHTHNSYFTGSAESLDRALEGFLAELSS